MTQRVLHVVDTLEPQAGSVAISLAGLFPALAENGIQSHAVTADGSCGSTDSVRVAKFDVGTVAALIADVDLVHVHGWGSDLARSVASVARRAGKPYVISPLGGLSEGPYHKKSWRDRLRNMFGDRTLIRRAAAVAALNEWELGDLQSRSVNEMVTLLPYGLSVDEYENCKCPMGEASHTPVASEGRCLLMLGPIHPAEGFVPLLRAFAEIMSEAEGWSIVIAGPERGDWRKMLDASIKRKGVDDQVRLVSAPDLACQQAWLDRADILASPALHVRCPVSIMQAVAAGVMVIASKRAVPGGLNGVITTCGPSRSELKEALRSGIKMSDDERVPAARKAKAVGRSVFDWSVLAEQYVQLYKRLG